jgi:chromate transport protein ChrA
MRSTWSWSSLSRLATTTRKRLLPSSEIAFTNPVLDMLAHNWHIALTAFGGPAVHFQIFRRVFVDEYKWIDESTYTEMFALCQALSGPASTKMIYHINVIHYGFWTGFLSFFVWSLPTALAGFGLAMGVGQVGEQLPPLAYALLSGLNSATVGIIALAAVQLSNKAATDTLTSILVFLGATAGMLYNALWYFPVLMMLGALAAVVWDLRLMQRSWKRLRCGSSQQDVRREEGPEPVQMHDLSRGNAMSATGNDIGHSTGSGLASHESQAQIPEPTFRTKQSPLSSWQFGAIIIAAFFASFIVVMVCRGLYSGTNRLFDLHANLYLAGTIIFGGGPVVIPLLREYVVAPGWVSSRDFLLGLAVMQAFPGPNFNFAVYLGALAVQGTGIPPFAGAIIGFLAIFSPGIWLYTGFIGLWEKVRKIQAVRAALRGVHAAAVGLVFTAVYRLFEIGYLDENVQSGGSLSRDPWWIVIVATSFVGGLNFKVPPPLAIIVGAVMGLIWYGVVRA